MWKPVGSSTSRLATVSCAEVAAAAAATHSVALTVPMAGRARLLLTALYAPAGVDNENDNDSAGGPDARKTGTDLMTVHAWWPADVDQWLAASAALRGATARELGCGDAASRHLARPHVALPDLYKATGWDMGRTGVRLVALAAEVRAERTLSESPPPPDAAGDDRQDADAIHVVYAGRHTLGLPSAEWRAFCRLVAQRDAALRRAIEVDPTVYGARGSFVVTSLLRTEEALGRRWRLDPALPDPDAVAALRRSFVAVADARRLAADSV
ncbi:hypothetical protein psal_cds_1198 [Pandoravirus salinus]|uniref:Uncharacterized protein n=1 Tax=Pandoravirus salinus TaxID=1349410 RepID=A0A291ATT0_9VIRU|nr:hypothetical protein psal_cds_1198 [Pandoravirus salinus]ATE82293.1 hypothetical protein psal_cds_1198 [Pandoravirus salinus]